MKIFSIKDLIVERKTVTRPVLDVAIKNQIDLKNFTITDKSEVPINMEITSVKPSVMKHFFVGAHLRVINPVIEVSEKKIIINNDTRIFKIGATSGKFTFKTSLILIHTDLISMYDG